MEDTNSSSNLTKQFVFVMETLYMPNIYVMTARKAVLRLDTQGMLELVALSVDASSYEQIFKAPLSQVTKVNTVLSMTYIHLGKVMFRMYDQPIYNVADMKATLNDATMTPLLNEAPTQEVITSTKKLAKRLKSLGVNSKYMGLSLIALFTVLGIFAMVAVVMIFGQA